MFNLNAPFYPIIYVRGYAMSRGEINETTADPFCGFNLGSTVYRATPDKNKPANKFIFESPVVRLMTDFKYLDIFEDGLDIMDPGWNRSIPSRSIIIYRYYEQASTLLGSGKTPDIEKFAEDLSGLILRVRDFVCKDPKNQVSAADFRCYLVAHSMGGLVCRAFMQNPKLGDKKARKCVDKIFTYATPHNGIEMANIKVPIWLSVNDINNFNRERMAEYLNLGKLFKKPKGRVDWLPEECFPSDRFFCMVGTNRGDYEVAMGLSRTFAGHGSDGLVRIENASVWGVDKKGNFTAPSATAYAYRSHSGYFGIVNSEESYQNLVRFLFGNVRVDIWADVEDIRLPEALCKEGNVNALYQFEILASPRGKPWYLTRRKSEEDSVACRTYEELTDEKKKEKRQVYLSTIFLNNSKRNDHKHDSIAYGITLGIPIPDYEVDKKLWLDQHYEGRYLFQDLVIIKMTPSKDVKDRLEIEYLWHNDDAPDPSKQIEFNNNSKTMFTIPFKSKSKPDITGSINGKLRFVVSKWNATCS